MHKQSKLSHSIEELVVILVALGVFVAVMAGAVLLGSEATRSVLKFFH